MPVIKVEKDRRFTVMSNYHLNDKALTMKARGLLSTMLSLPPEWDYTVAGLATLSPDGVASIRSALDELEAAGYMQRRQLHSTEGKFSGNEYVIYEQPPTPESPLCENRITAPLCEKPLTGKPSTENRTQVNTNLVNTNIPPIAPQGGKRERKNKTAPDWKPERFEKFWEAYPCGKAKQAAIRAWDGLRPDDDLLTSMARALGKQMRSEEWQRGIGIPHASTWINQRRWEDEEHDITQLHAAPTSGWADDPEVLRNA